MILFLYLLGVVQAQYTTNWLTESQPWFTGSSVTPYYRTIYTEQTLGPPDQDGARQVMKVRDPAVRYCGTGGNWNDLDADAVCKLAGFENGRRGDVITKNIVSKPIISCHEFRNVNDFYGLYVFVICFEDFIGLAYNLDWNPIDWYHHYCPSNQVAAVFCWNEELVLEASLVAYEETAKRWVATFTMQTVKYGKNYRFLSKKGSINSKPKKKEFKVEGCGETATSVKLKLDKKKMQMTLKGKWPRKCGECLQFYYKADRILEDSCLSKITTI